MQGTSEKKADTSKSIAAGAVFFELQTSQAGLERGDKPTLSIYGMAVPVKRADYQVSISIRTLPPPRTLHKAVAHFSRAMEQFLTCNVRSIDRFAKNTVAEITMVSPEFTRPCYIIG